MRGASKLLPLVFVLTIAASLLVNSTAAPDGDVGRIKGVGALLRPAVDNQRHLYVLDGWGGLHPVGSAPALSASASWPTKDIAYSLALFPDGTGGYVVDGWGGLHPVGAARPVDSEVYWPHWVGAREVVMAPWASSASGRGIFARRRRRHPSVRRRAWCRRQRGLAVARHRAGSGPDAQ